MIFRGYSLLIMQSNSFVCLLLSEASRLVAFYYCHLPFTEYWIVCERVSDHWTTFGFRVHFRQILQYCDALFIVKRDRITVESLKLLTELSASKIE